MFALIAMPFIFIYFIIDFIIVIFLQHLLWFQFKSIKATDFTCVYLSKRYYCIFYDTLMNILNTCHYAIKFHNYQSSLIWNVLKLYFSLNATTTKKRQTFFIVKIVILKKKAQQKRSKLHCSKSTMLKPKPMKKVNNTPDDYIVACHKPIKLNIDVLWMKYHKTKEYKWIICEME